MSSVSNIQRRFGLLFTLPSTTLALLLSSTVSVLIVLLGFPFREVSVLLLAPIMLVSFLLSIGVEKVILQNSPFSTVRRLLGMAIVPITSWLVVGSIGLIVSLSTNSSDKFYVAMLMGMFLAVGIRVLIFGGIFFEKLVVGFLVSFIQPIFLMVVVIPFSQIQPLMLVLGSMIPLSVLSYQEFLVRRGENILKYSPLKLLRMFLLAWATDRPHELEEIFERESSSRMVTSTTLEFAGKNHSQIVMIVPGVHPGPFYPVGSSNLPFQLYQWFSTQKFLPLVFHGISGHDLNLPSGASVQKYINSMNDLKQVAAGNQCSVPISASMNRATVTGMVFGDSVLLFLSLAPYGGEDFPKFVKEDINELALNNGFINCLIIDSHNSRGATPDDSDCRDLITVAGVMLGEMRFLRQDSFRTGYAHSSELGEVLNSDVGPGGISLIMFEVGGRSFSIVSADSNNIVIGFRELVSSLLEITLVELCTTDTHFNASKVMNPLGYLALGDVSHAGNIASLINRLADSARNRVINTSYKVRMVKNDVNVVGGNVLDIFSSGLDKMIRYAKMGGIISSVFIISIITLSISI